VTDCNDSKNFAAPAYNPYMANAYGVVPTSASGGLGAPVSMMGMNVIDFKQDVVMPSVSEVATPLDNGFMQQQQQYQAMMQMQAQQQYQAAVSMQAQQQQAQQQVAQQQMAQQQQAQQMAQQQAVSHQAQMMQANMMNQAPGMYNPYATVYQNPMYMTDPSNMVATPLMPPGTMPTVATSLPLNAVPVTASEDTNQIDKKLSNPYYSTTEFAVRSARNERSERRERCKQESEPATRTTRDSVAKSLYPTVPRVSAEKVTNNKLPSTHHITREMVSTMVSNVLNEVNGAGVQGKIEKPRRR
jgi:hypothetical protein